MACGNTPSDDKFQLPTFMVAATVGSYDPTRELPGRSTTSGQNLNVQNAKRNIFNSVRREVWNNPLCFSDLQVTFPTGTACSLPYGSQDLQYPLLICL